MISTVSPKSVISYPIAGVYLLARLSDGKSKGSGNRKNGNRYLSWAFTEAVHLGRRYNERFRAYYNRKVAQGKYKPCNESSWVINWLVSVITLLKIKFLFVRNCSLIKPGTATGDPAVLVAQNPLSWLARRCSSLNENPGGCPFL